MQIFALSTSPYLAARYHANTHVVKMVTESCQLLSAVLHLGGMKAPYKLTHKNHPCRIWASYCIGNYRWLWDLANALGKEYTYRYGKSHKAHRTLVRKIPRNPPNHIFKVDRNLRYKFANATRKSKRFLRKYGHLDLVDYTVYREFYVYEKKRLLKYKRRSPPYWIF